MPNLPMPNLPMPNLSLLLLFNLVSDTMPESIAAGITAAILGVVLGAIFGERLGNIFGERLGKSCGNRLGKSCGERPRWGRQQRQWWPGIMAVGLSGAIALGLAVPSAAAEFCRTLGANQICIVEIHRSAKHYWEYRAKVRINGQMRAIARYNCRTRVWRDRRGKTHDFEPDGAGQLICKTLL
jgi:hypothetical protein